MEQLVTIGEFAERCALSRSALRFYDQNDLLRPRLVDADSGYRYYATAQLEQALLVRRLRAAEMPVAALREYLASSHDRRRAILDEHAASFRERALAVETAVSELHSELARTQNGTAARWFSVGPEAFAGALDQLRFAVADPAVRADLGGVWIETKDDSVRLVATDSYRLAVRDLLPEQLGSAGVRGMIDADHARRLAHELQATDTLTLSQDQQGAVTATIGGRASVVGGTGEGFPDYERILSGLPVGHQIALARVDIEQALAGLPLDADHLRLRFEQGRLLLEALGRRTSVAGSWPGPTLTMIVDRRFFAEAVEATVGPDVVIDAVDPLQPITLRSADTGTFSVLTMPIRAPDPE